MVVWLHILGPYWCLYVALFSSHTTTVLTTNRCILMDYFNGKHKLMRSLMMV